MSRHIFSRIQSIARYRAYLNPVSTGKRLPPTYFRAASTVVSPDTKNAVEDDIKAEITPKTNGNGTAPTSASDPFPTPQSYTGDGSRNDWSRSFHGLSIEPFAKEVADVLMMPLQPEDIEIKPGE